MEYYRTLGIVFSHIWKIKINVLIDKTMWKLEICRESVLKR